MNVLIILKTIFVCIKDLFYLKDFGTCFIIILYKENFFSLQPVS